MTALKTLTWESEVKTCLSISELAETFARKSNYEFVSIRKMKLKSRNSGKNAINPPYFGTYILHATLDNSP
jgi:hypothetical protein